jgi:hypothetical protein
MMEAAAALPPPPAYVVVTHDHCHDGVTALWVIDRWLRAKGCDWEHVPGRYDAPPTGEELERYRGRKVVFADFTWKRDVMLAIAERSETFLVLDHHKTAEEELARFPLGIVIFDGTRSGAGLAWDYFFGPPRPKMVDYVEDRDLWLFRYPLSRAYHAFAGTFPLTLEGRQMLALHDADEVAAREGQAILRYHEQLIAEAKTRARPMDIGGHLVPVVRCPTMALVSDLGHALAEGAPFAACILDKPDGSQYVSLRSRPEGLDVSEVARRYGGGGHRGAAGYTIRPDAGVRGMDRMGREGDEVHRVP